MRRLALLLVLLLAVSAIPTHAQTDLPDTDGIPANCETASPYADPNLFPRYANGQLALIDWSSGEVARVLESDSAASNFWLLGWSPDCHYLAGGLGDGERYTTILWDATSGAQIGTVADGYRRPHFLTWSPRGDSLVVETRYGAFLWDLATGNRLQLTIDSFAGHSFRHIDWNYENDTLVTLTNGGGFVVFSLDNGRPLNLLLTDDQYIGSAEADRSDIPPIVTMATTQSPYPCEHYYGYIGYMNGRYVYGERVRIPNTYIRISDDRLILLEVGTGETLQVLDEDFALSVRRGWAYGELTANCEMFFSLLYTNQEPYLPREGVVIRLRDSVRVHTIPNMPARRSPDFPRIALLREQWDSTGRYLFAQSYDGAQVWDSATDTTFYVTSADESQRYGYSVNTVTWEVANGRISVDMLYSAEVRVFDLTTGLQVQ
ncbi:MAG: WD40 repeat domain-containing protein [Anaerolineae bacterium]|nr:WD40 repeat domain-containing protein [Anaerolineae bacterium]